MSMVKKQTINGIGMFDFCKGLTILSIVLYHTQEIWDFSNYPALNNTLNFVNTTFFYATNEAFFMMAGYNFRKRPNKKMLNMQLKQTVVPYYYAAAITIVLFFLVHFLFFHHLPHTLIETVRVGGGKLLGLSSTQKVFGFSFFSCGVGWFILAFFWIEVVCNAVVNYVPEKWNFLIFFLLFFLFFRFAPPNTSNWSYFSLLAGLAYTPFYYIGYLAKKKDFLNQNLMKPLLVSLGIGLMIYFVWTYTNGNFFLTMSSKPNYLVTIINDSLYQLICFCQSTVWAGFLILACLSISNVKSKVVNIFSIMGRHSMDVFYAHMVENSVFPWYLLTKIYRDHKILGFSVQILVRCTLIALMCAVMSYYRFLKRDWKFKRELQRENAGNV